MIALIFLLNSKSISIHAPTRGATTPSPLRCWYITLFQSTHLREVRHKSKAIKNRYNYNFNPRTYERCDGSYDLSNNRSARNFNPRTYERCDAVRFNAKSSKHLFQSTHLREVRPNRHSPTIHSMPFQSTHLREVRRTDRRDNSP